KREIILALGDPVIPAQDRREIILAGILSFPRRTAAKLSWHWDPVIPAQDRREIILALGDPVIPAQDRREIILALGDPVIPAQDRREIILALGSCHSRAGDWGILSFPRRRESILSE
ncbi:MAG: hypothetical protein JRH20_12400, partial [Deltaproteobacteria bacterium]|nr:hypothetical protein [Deltaproteobacteria bacterium]